MELELGRTMLAEQGRPQRFSADGGKARRMLAVLMVNRGTLGLALRPGLPQGHNGSIFAISCTGKLDERSASGSASCRLLRMGPNRWKGWKKRSMSSTRIAEPVLAGSGGSVGDLI
jgi:hypothetical protein